MRGLLVVLAVGLGCGARTGLDVDAGPRDGAVRRDAAPRDAAPRDAPIAPDVTEAPDAFVPVACDGRPLPRPVGTTTVEVPPRMQGLGVQIPDPLGILVVGGLVSSGVFADRMVFLDLDRSRAQEVPVAGDRVDLPLESGVAVYVPRGDLVVVIGGLIDTGDPTDQVFLFTGEGDPSGLRQVRA